MTIDERLEALKRMLEKAAREQLKTEKELRSLGQLIRLITAHRT